VTQLVKDIEAAARLMFFGNHKEGRKRILYCKSLAKSRTYLLVKVAKEISPVGKPHMTVEQRQEYIRHFHGSMAHQQIARAMGA
jgi:hypothetical protein